MAPTFEQLLARNREYAKTATPVPLISELSGSNSAVPTIVIFSCLDFRMEPSVFLGIEPGGSEAFVFRNAGGSVLNSLADLLVMDKFLQHQIKEIIVIHHADCGVEHVTARELKNDLERNHPNLIDRINKLHFDTHDSDRPDISVQRDVHTLRNCPFFRKELSENVKGYVFDLKTNRLNLVD